MQLQQAKQTYKKRKVEKLNENLKNDKIFWKIVFAGVNSDRVQEEEKQKEYDCCNSKHCNETKSNNVI